MVIAGYAPAGVDSSGGSQSSSKVLEEMVKVTVAKIKLSQNRSHLLALLANGAEDAVNNYVGSDDVKFTRSRTDNFVSADLKIFFGEECVEIHSRGWCELM